MHLVLGNAGATSGRSLEASGLPGDQLIASHRLRIANPTTMMAGQALVRALVVIGKPPRIWQVDMVIADIHSKP